MNLLLEPPAFQGTSSWPCSRANEHAIHPPTPNFSGQKLSSSTSQDAQVLMTNVEEGPPKDGDSGGNGPVT